MSYGPSRAPAENSIREARADYSDYLLGPPFRDRGPASTDGELIKPDVNAASFRTARVLRSMARPRVRSRRRSGCPRDRRGCIGMMINGAGERARAVLSAAIR